MNQRPLACEASALPLSYAPSCLLIIRFRSRRPPSEHRGRPGIYRELPGSTTGHPENACRWWSSRRGCYRGPPSGERVAIERDVGQRAHGDRGAAVEVAGRLLPPRAQPRRPSANQESHGHRQCEGSFAIMPHTPTVGASRIRNAERRDDRSWPAPTTCVGALPEYRYPVAPVSWRIEGAEPELLPSVRVAPRGRLRSVWRMPSRCPSLGAIGSGAGKCP